MYVVSNIICDITNHLECSFLLSFGRIQVAPLAVVHTAGSLPSGLTEIYHLLPGGQGRRDSGYLSHQSLRVRQT